MQPRPCPNLLFTPRQEESGGGRTPPIKDDRVAPTTRDQCCLVTLGSTGAIDQTPELEAEAFKTPQADAFLNKRSLVDLAP